MSKNNNDYKTYLKKLKALQIGHRAKKQQIADEYIEQLTELKNEFNIPSKDRATENDLYRLIGIVLDTGKSGTKAIRQYAKEIGKSDKWIHEIAKPRAGESFKAALNRHENNNVISSMKSSGIYDMEDILNNSITGALTKLSKQRQILVIIDELRDEIVMLKASLAAKAEGEDWEEEARRLSDLGKSYSEIGRLLGYSKSMVGKVLKGYKKADGETSR